MKKRLLTILLTSIMLLAALSLSGCAQSNRTTLETLTGVPKSAVRYVYVDLKPVELDVIYEYYEQNYEEYTGDLESKTHDTLSVYDEDENLLFILENMGDKGVIRISGIDGYYHKVSG